MTIKFESIPFDKTRILVIGDIMLDRYLWGDVKRISPEAPVPVFHIKRRSIVPGGAGNVVLNLNGLGTSITLIGVTGEDENGKMLCRLFEDIHTETIIFKDKTRPTITKTRIVSSGQQLLRIDDEINLSLDDPMQSMIIESICKQIPKHDAIILSDYGKGFFQTPDLTETIIKSANMEGIPVVVDPKGHNWERYKGAACITPNTAEFELVYGKIVSDEEALFEAMETICSKYLLPNLLVTRGPLGMCLCATSGNHHTIPSIARQVYDVSGAGDTVIATFTACIAAGLGYPDAAYLANIAAGVVVGKLGTQAINAMELRAALEMNSDDISRGSNYKINSLAAAAVQVQAWKAGNEKIVFTNGCFDLLHPGHIYLLNEAKKHGDRLIVGLNSDTSVRRLKGATRPVLSENDRAAILGALDCVDLVIIFKENTPVELIESLKPDILIKGADYSLEKVVGAHILESYGGEIHLVPLLKGYSTTRLMEKVALA